jgi:hypothetical protein
MEIIESLVIEQSEGLFIQLSDQMPFSLFTEHPLKIYRLEVEPDLMMYFYVLDSRKNIPIDWLLNIFPSLKRIIFLADRNGVDEWELSDILIENIQRYIPSIPSYAIIFTDKKLDRAEFFSNELPIKENVKILCWHRSDKIIWRQIWKEIFLSQEPVS